MITIYYTTECPFCQKVLHKMDELGLKVNVDVKMIPAYRATKEAEELKKLGGKVQVPFLVDGDIKMYESEDICEYLEKKFKDR